MCRPIPSERNRILGVDPPPPRVFVDQPLMPGEVALSAAEDRHVRSVRRLRGGDAVWVLNGRGQVGTGLLAGPGRMEISQVEEASRSAPRLTLYMGAVKPSAWEEVIRHAVELGVDRLVRVQCTHAVSRLEGGKAEKKMARWRDLMIEACKQSANPWLPELSTAESVAAACTDPECPAAGLLAQLTGDSVAFAGALSGSRPESLAVWVGPEGDFTPEETARIRASGAVPVSLGPRILRAETAALAIASAVRMWRF